MRNKTPRNKKGEPHGLWELYNIDGTIWYKRNYINGEQFGYYEYFYGDNRNANKIYYAR